MELQLSQWRKLVFLLFIPVISSERILFLLPLSSKSMVNIFDPLALGLSQRGHQLTIITPAKFRLPDNKNVTQVIPIEVDELYKDYPSPLEIRRQNKMFRFPVPFMLKYCNILYDDPEFMKILSEKFDLVVMNIIHHDCFAPLLLKMGSPIIQISTLPMPSSQTETWGLYQPSSFVPICINGDISHKFSFRQRVKNFLYNIYVSIVLYVWTMPPLENFYRTRLSDQGLPGVVEIYKKQVSLLLVNANFALTTPRPSLPNFVDIGGIHCKPAKKLPKHLEEFVNGAEHGFIVFSLGSIMKATDLPESSRLAFLAAFSKLKERVIWKWEKDGMSDLPDNVKVVKWLPQQDLLGHPKIKLFITHGGLLSTEEAAYHGVPVLGMPIFVDQDTNMRQAEVLGFGVKGEILDITEQKLTPYIRRVLDNPSYMKRAKELSAIFRDSQETPLERAVFWTEYVLRHKGARHLRSSGMDLNIFQYHSIDVVVFLVGVSLTFILFGYYLITLLIRTLLWILGISKDSKRKTKRVNIGKRDGIKKKRY